MSKQALNIDDNDTNAIDYQNPSLWNHQLGQQNVQGGTSTEGFTNAVAKFTFNGGLRRLLVNCFGEINRGM